MSPVEFHQDVFSAQKYDSQAIMWCCLHDSGFTGFDGTSRNWHTDRWS